MNNFYMIDEKILYICRCEYNYFLQKPNVVGVSLGYKIIKGFSTYIKCIKVLVSKKVSINQLTCREKVPKYYRGINTDVVETGSIISCGFTNRIRPVPGGYSMGPTIGAEGGTMACVVRDNENYYVLGSNHVFAYGNSVPLGTPIIQPALIDGGKAPNDTVANLSKYIPLRYTTATQTPENYVDAAIGKVSDKTLVSTKIAGVGSIRGLDKPQLGELIQKSGRTTEVTYGKILGLGATVQIDYNTGRCLFKDQIVTTKISQTGDSGALLLNMKKYVLGMLFSGSDTNSFFNYIDTVLDSLNVRIVR